MARTVCVCTVLKGTSALTQLLRQRGATNACFSPLPGFASCCTIYKSITYHSRACLLTWGLLLHWTKCKTSAPPSLSVIQFGLCSAAQCTIKRLLGCCWYSVFLCFVLFSIANYAKHHFCTVYAVKIVLKDISFMIYIILYMKKLSSKTTCVTDVYQVHILKPKNHLLVFLPVTWYFWMYFLLNAWNKVYWHKVKRLLLFIWHK